MYSAIRRRIFQWHFKKNPNTLYTLHFRLNVSDIYEFQNPKDTSWKKYSNYSIYNDLLILCIHTCTAKQIHIVKYTTIKKKWLNDDKNLSTLIHLLNNANNTTGSYSCYTHMFNCLCFTNFQYEKFAFSRPRFVMFVLEWIDWSSKLKVRTKFILNTSFPIMTSS
jgi:hypothetical protein